MLGGEIIRDEQKPDDILGKERSPTEVCVVETQKEAEHVYSRCSNSYRINLAKARDGGSLDRHVVINDACVNFTLLCLAALTGRATVMTILQQPSSHSRRSADIISNQHTSITVNNRILDHE
jgi:hypothetical protein